MKVLIDIEPHYLTQKIASILKILETIVNRHLHKKKRLEYWWIVKESFSITTTLDHTLLCKLVKQLLLELGWDVLVHPSYSSDLTFLDYYLFLSLQNSLQWKLPLLKKPSNDTKNIFSLRKTASSLSGKFCNYQKDGKR